MALTEGTWSRILRKVQLDFLSLKYAIYQKYLTPQEMGFLRKNYTSSTSKFPVLIAEVFQHMEDGIAPHDPRVRQLALRWIEIVRSYAGDDPETQGKLREAMAQHPELLEGSGIDQRLLGYVRLAIAQLKPH